jgi:hypothetical protein
LVGSSKGKNTKLAAISTKGLFTDSLGHCYNYSNVYLSKYKDGTYINYILAASRIRHAQLLNNSNALLASNQTIFECFLPNGTITPIKTKATTLLHDINKTFFDSYKNCWILGNTDSVIVLDRNYNLKTIVPLPLKNINCRNIIQASNNEFYLATNKGLFQIAFKDSTLATYSIQLFDQTNGLLSNDIYNVCFFQEKLYISSSKGICFVNAIQTLKHSAQPRTDIKACWVNDSVLNPSVDSVFTYKQKNFSFQVDAMAFKKTGQRGAFFKYRLDGWENEFKLATGNTINYSNLPPGTYTFIAKTFYDDATEDATPATVSFTIKPAFWQTWWGISLIGLAAISLVFLFVQWRIRKIRKIEKEKAEVNKTIAEYRYTALKAQMDPHFIFNSINVIQNLILEKDKTQAYNSLEKFSRLIRMVLNQSDSVFATVEEEMALINLYVQLNQLRLDCPFSFTVDIQAEALQCSIPSLIIQPFIENALWHGILPLKGTKEGLIFLKIFLRDEKILIIEVRDNGIGRTAATKKIKTSHTSKGVKLIEERLEAYRSMNNNCYAELKIIDMEENGTAAGTLVQIIIELREEY